MASAFTEASATAPAAVSATASTTASDDLPHASSGSTTVSQELIDSETLQERLAAIIASISSDKFAVSGDASATETSTSIMSSRRPLAFGEDQDRSDSGSDASSSGDLSDLSAAISRQISDQISKQLSDQIGQELAAELDAQLDAQLDAAMEQEWRKSFYDSVDAELDRQMDEQIQSMIDAQRTEAGLGDEDASDADYWDKQLAALCERAPDFGADGDAYDYDLDDFSDDYEEHGDGEDGGYSNDGEEEEQGSTIGDVEALSSYFNPAKRNALARLRLLGLAAPTDSDAADGELQRQPFGGGSSGARQLSQGELHALLDSVYGPGGTGEGAGGAQGGAPAAVAAWNADK
ncbi:hypothetical protein JKP88DRAFT_263292 [Tribonema minus]|uniref:Uncharacterized protein n=1 Tax=Tribonema minus TaxID=303371 RepID=A0A836CDY0_9STRA|nr:hypothetical protein JKP88DRAFT_263292 [Tribonema minus]